MSALPWFRMYAAEELLSTELEDLSDHAARVWHRLVCVASLGAPRWQIPPATAGLSRRLLTTPAKLGALLEEFERRGLLERCEGALLVTARDRYEPPPSSSSRERVDRLRNRRREAEGVTAVTVTGVTGCNAGNGLDQIRSEKETEREERRGQQARPEQAARPASGAQLPLQPLMVAVASHRGRYLLEGHPLGEAQKLGLRDAYLEQGLSPADAAQRAGIEAAS